MTTIVLNGSMDIGYKGVMFKRPECKYEIKVDLPEGINEAHNTIIAKMFDKLFKAAEVKLNKERAAAIKKAMEQTEREITKNPRKTPAEMTEFLQTADKLIRQGVDTWAKNMVPAAVHDVVNKVMDAVDAKLNTKLNREGVKCVCYIVFLSVLTLAVAGTGIAVTVLSGGALAPIVIGAIVAGVGALSSVAQITKTNYNAYNSTLDEIQKALTELDTAIKYQEKKKRDLENREKKTLGPKEFIKLMLSGTAPIVKKLEDKLAVADAKNILSRKSTAEAKKKVIELQAEVDKMVTANTPDVAAKAEKMKAQLYAARKAVDKADEQLQNYSEFSKQVKGALQRVKDKGADFDGIKLSGLSRFCLVHQEEILLIGTSIATIVTNGVELRKLIVA